MSKLGKAGKTRRKKKFVLYDRRGNQLIWLFRFIVIEQIYDGSKWRSNRYLIDRLVKEN